MFNYAYSDITDPTIIRNSYTKTVSLLGTKNNNKIFGEYWRLDRSNGNGNSGIGIDYIPSKKVDFRITCNGNVYQDGYCKLDSVVRNKYNITYNLTLYGGLGSFFSNLTYLNNNTSDNTKRTLSDMYWFDDDDGKELGTKDNELFKIKINKDSLNDAWNRLESGGTNDSVYDIINFAPCYSDKYNNFDTDKAVINCLGLPIQTSTTEGHSSIGGYVLGDLGTEINGYDKVYAPSA